MRPITPYAFLGWCESYALNLNYAPSTLRGTSLVQLKTDIEEQACTF